MTEACVIDVVPVAPEPVAAEPVAAEPPGAEEPTTTPEAEEPPAEEPVEQPPQAPPPAAKKRGRPPGSKDARPRKRTQVQVQPLGETPEVPSAGAAPLEAPLAADDPPPTVPQPAGGTRGAVHTKRAYREPSPAEALEITLKHLHDMSNLRQQTSEEHYTRMIQHFFR
jgi:hypothetical protein